MKETAIPTVIPNGSTFRYEDRKYHVVCSFLDADRYIYVMKFFGKYKQWWHYEAWDAQELDSRIEYNLIKDLTN